MSLLKLMCEGSDVSQHVGILAGLGCDRDVVEFGFRTGRSAEAFLQGGCRSLRSYDIAPCLPQSVEYVKDPRFRFIQMDSAKVDLSAEGCDVLFIDSLHTGEHIAHELRNAPYVRHAIAMHDTVKFGEVNAKMGTTGLLPTIRSFLANGGWRIAIDIKDRYGLMVLVPA